jgi:long-subunit acyl-CoA synthetase (AMP-forming)
MELRSHAAQVAAGYYPSLLHWLLHWARTQPDSVYLTQPLPDGRIAEYRWCEVADQALRFAAYLDQLQLPPRSSVALLGKNSAHWIMADLAIGLAGHVSVPLYSTLNAPGAAYVLEHSDARLLLVGRLDSGADALLALAGAIKVPVVSLPQAPMIDVPRWEDIVAAHTPLPEPKLPLGGEVATIAYTSGSTGRPKGVMHSHANMLCFAEGFNQGFALDTGDRMLSYLPLAHLAERGLVEANSLRHGFGVWFNDSLASFADDLRRARPTVFFSVPRLWTRFYQSIQAGFPQLERASRESSGAEAASARRQILAQLGLEQVRCAMTGSAPLSPEIISWYRELGLELLEGYGMSENFGYSHGSRLGEVRLGYVGHPAPGVECRLGDDGEVLVRSPAQMLGYYKDPDLSAASLTADGFLKTGDRGVIDECGRLRITGRVKDLFKTSKGKYVAPAPIENLLGRHPRVEAACVAGLGLPQPLALLVIGGASELGATQRDAIARELATLLAEVNGDLADHERLCCLVVVDEPWTIDNGCLTVTLKIRRDAIEARHARQCADWHAHGAAVIWEADRPLTE